MLYTKEITEISYQDVETFCKQKYSESIHLDYKEDIDKSLAKTICALANTWGGLIIIGIEDEDSKPKIPLKGIEYKEHLREQVNNIILDNIYPPVFPEIQVCEPVKNKTFIVIRVPQSIITPHAIKHNTQVYIRTNLSNEPEELATVERIEWLKDRRRKSEELKRTFYETAYSLYLKECKNNKLNIPHSEVIFSISPNFPYESFVSPIKLRSEVVGKIKTNGYGGNWYPLKDFYEDFKAIQNGISCFFVNEMIKYIYFNYINEYGFFMIVDDIGDSNHIPMGSDENKNPKYKTVEIFGLYRLFIKLDLLLESMFKFYKELGYWGFLELRIKINKLNPELDIKGFRNTLRNVILSVNDDTRHTLQDNLEWTRIFSVNNLKDKRKEIFKKLILEIAWGLGFENYNEDLVDRILNENKR